MLKRLTLVTFVSVLLIASSCRIGEKKYHLTKREKGKQNFWAKHSLRMVNRNLENKDKNQKKANELKEKEQKYLNKLNAKKSSGNKQIESFQFFVY